MPHTLLSLKSKQNLRKLQKSSSDRTYIVPKMNRRYHVRLSQHTAAGTETWGISLRIMPLPTSIVV